MELDTNDPPEVYSLNRTQLTENDDLMLANAMDNAVRLLFPEPGHANAYIQAHPSHKLRFYVYESLPKNYTWQALSNCIEKRYNVPDWIKHMTKDVRGMTGTDVSNCDWGASICTQTISSSSEYSSRRFNRNGDVVLAKIFSEYQGALRTFDATKADFFIVPYAATAHCACRNDRARCKLVSTDEIKTNVLENLNHLNNDTLTRHVFLSSVQRELNHPFMKTLPLVITLEAKVDACPLHKPCGHIIQPYVNTNDFFQPNSAEMLEIHANPSLDKRPYAIGAVMSGSIKSQDTTGRKEFLQEMEKLTAENNTIAGRPVQVVSLDRRVLSNERNIFSIYQQSIFCPCFRGNTPAQKRFFDVILNGCIPLVLQYYESHEAGYPSFFKPRGTSIRISYPYSTGLFHREPNMGIDYSKLVVTINGTCGVPCLVPKLEDLLINHPEQVAQLQQRVSKVAKLFSYGMEQNALQHVDAVAALLVQVRHYVTSQ